MSVFPLSREHLYDEKFREPLVTDKDVNPFKIKHCSSKNCDQYVSMKLIVDALNNSSSLVYAGNCVNGHYNEEIPSVPIDSISPLKCKICHAYMQYKMSIEFNGWICIMNHKNIPKQPKLIFIVRYAINGNIMEIFNDKEDAEKLRETYNHKRPDWMKHTEYAEGGFYVDEQEIY